MRKLSIPLIVTVLFAVVLGVTIASRNNDSAATAQPQIVQPVIPLGTQLTSEQPADPCAYAEQEEPGDSAEQILNDMNDAHVEERTGDLMVAFNHLGKLCNDAVKTADAMLSVSFDGKATGDANSLKGTEDGNE